MMDSLESWYYVGVAILIIVLVVPVVLYYGFDISFMPNIR